VADDAPSPEDIAAARQVLPRVRASEAVIEALCGTAMALGISSARASLLAVNAARAAAALDGRCDISLDDAALACRLVLAPRATVLPAGEPPPEEGEAPEEAAENPPETPPDNAEDKEDDAPPTGEMAEILLQAVQAAIPPGLLAQLKSLAGKGAKTPTAGRVGEIQNAGMRGRPAGVRAGEPRGGLRLNVIETLRAAAPWQPIRRAESGRADGIAVRREDFRINRLKQRAETTTIFVVDASGSSALNRLAEAKGAVELLLADCYVRRDRVAVVAFRGRAAQLLLPPTRSLVRAKRSLAGLPGGGGTPLAAGIAAGMELADATRRRGGTPTIVLLTDGRANVSHDGTGGRARADQEAQAAARRVRAARFGCLLIDMSPRANPAAQRLAGEMGARYLMLPYANATLLSQAVRAAAASA
jgi:magnesium chelatase subunit D